MNKVFKCYVFESYEEMWETATEYIKRLYTLVFVNFIFTSQYAYCITCKDGFEPEVIAVPNDDTFEEWTENYAPEPEMGQVMLRTYLDHAGYAISFDMMVLTEPEDLEEFGEEVVCQ